MKTKYKKYFNISEAGKLFMERAGPWKGESQRKKMRSKYIKHSNKLCIYSTSIKEVAKALYEISKNKECFAVKYLSKKKGGLCTGRAFIANEEILGKLWAKYSSHPKLMCTIQNDNYIAPFRKMVKKRWNH